MRKGVSSGFTVAVGFAMRALLALLLCAGAMQASADAAATVLFSQGSVTAVSQNSSRALHKGDSIVAGDTINTGGDGRIQMRFSDGGLVSLRPNSSFAVDKYNQPTAGSEGSLAFNLIKGGLRTLSGTIGHEDHANYQLKTSVATLGIRGTEFVVVMDGQIMRVHVGHGEVSIYNQFGELLVSAGQNGMVMPGQAPESSYIVPSTGDGGNGGNGGAGGNGGVGGNGSGAGLIGAGGNGGLSDSSLNQTLPSDFLQGKDGGVAIGFAQVSSLAYDASLDDQPDVPFSFDATSAILGGKGLPSGLNTGNPASTQAAPPEVNVTGGLVWGEVESDALNDPELGSPLFSKKYDAYVLGTPATDIPLTGSLYYFYNTDTMAATAVRDAAGGSTGLSQFNLAIHLGPEPTFQATVELQNETFFDSSTVAGHMQGAAFNFQTTGGGEVCGTCTLNVAGFLSGNIANNESQAGVTYRLSAGELYTGAAVLQQGEL
jgi:hypothetical protein